MKTNRKYIFAIPAILMVITIFILSQQSHPINEDLGINLNDKLLHLIGYFVFGITLLLAFTGLKYEWSNKRIFLWVSFIGAIYAASDEFHQYFIPGRSCDIYDWLADCCGILLSLILFKLIRRICKWGIEL